MTSTPRTITSRTSVTVLLMAVFLGAAGCRSNGEGNVPLNQRGMSDTMDIVGFFADLTQNGIRVERVNAESAVYHMSEGLFELKNVRVEFFDPKGLRVIEELFCDSGVWYTQPHPAIERGKSDMDLSGHVFYRSLETGSALRTDTIYFNNDVGRFISDAPFVQLMLKREDNSMLVLRGEGFQTDKGFQNWSYAKTRTQNEIFDEETYRTLVGDAPTTAPAFRDYEGL